MSDLSASVVAGIAVLLGAVLLKWVAGRPFPHRRVYPRRIRKLLEALLKRGYDTGVLRLEVHVPLRQRIRLGLRPFIQFRKYITAPGKCGIEFGFPNTRWSSQIFPVIREVCESAGLEYDVRPTDSAQTTAFLCVDLGHDVERADVLARDALERALGVGENTSVTGYLMGISPRDETIC